MQTVISVRRCRNQAVNMSKDRKSPVELSHGFQESLWDGLAFALEKWRKGYTYRETHWRISPTPGVWPWNLKKSLRRAKQEEGDKTGRSDALLGRRDTLYVEMVRFRPLFSPCSRHHSLECLEKCRRKALFSFLECARWHEGQVETVKWPSRRSIQYENRPFIFTLH